MRVPVPSPLSVPARAYAAACESAALSGGFVGAMDRYRAFYREGAIPAIGPAFEVPRVGRLHRSDSAEGEVRKFTLPVSGAGAPVASTLSLLSDTPLETESVVIPMIGRKRVLTHTLCVSSQVGCAMGCVFCQTAQMGLIRSLTPAEIVAQWWAARHGLSDGGGGLGGCDTIRNVVFMGMGEPMDNLEAVLDAIAILTDHNGPGLPMSKITISTVGRVDGIERLAAKIREPGWHRLNLAISVNAPSDEIRSRIMPVNRAMPLARLRAALESWPIYGAAKLCIEYVLIPGVNDAQEHARLLGDWVLGRAEYDGRPALPGLVNVIPYNPRDNSPWPAPEEDAVDRFLGWCLETRLYAKRRRTKGRDTMAACGQLGNPEIRRKRREAVGGRQ